MKLLVFSDLHGDWTTGGFERFDELSQSLDQVHAHAVSCRVDMVAFLGDLTDPDVDPALTHRTVARAVEFHTRLRDAGIADRWLVGNHDVIEDGRGSHTLMALEKAGARVFSKPRNEIINHAGGRLELVWLPYAGLGNRYEPDRYVRELAASHAMGLKGGTLIVLGHMTRVPGAVDGSETRDMPRGRDMEFPLEACEVLRQVGGYGTTLYCNGHFHQRVIDGPVLIPGAMARLTHGEEHHQPGFLLIEV